MGSYDKQVDLYNTENILDWTLEEKDQFKLSLYNFKVWISEYHSKILPNEEKIGIDSMNDTPTKLF
jgi:hypothetical protein